MVLVLSSCGVLLQPGEPTKKYTLDVLGDKKESEIGRRSHQLVVELPMIYPPLDNTRIALKPQAQVIDYYADVEWADRLNALIQESVIYSLQNKRIFKGVSRPAEVFKADYALKVEVRKFYTTSSYTAEVDYMVHLIRLPERQIIVSQQFSSAQPILENSMDAIVAALNKAHLETSKALIEWVLQQVY